MSKQYLALTALKTYLPAHMDAAPCTNLTAGQFAIDYPDGDNLRYPTMVYIVPENETMEYESINTIGVTMNVKIYILLRSIPMATMIQNAYEYYAALVNAIGYDETLGGAILEANITGAEFYPAVAGLTKTAGIEISAVLKYERPPLLLPDGDIYPSDEIVPVGG
jgi:hypothetical protein